MVLAVSFRPETISHRACADGNVSHLACFLLWSHLVEILGVAGLLPETEGILLLDVYNSIRHSVLILCGHIGFGLVQCCITCSTFCFLLLALNEKDNWNGINDYHLLYSFNCPMLF